MKFKHLLVLTVMLFAVLVPATPALALSSKDIQKELMCQCGCTMVVDVCDCGTADQIRAKITELMNQGQSKPQILAYFVNQYGEKMLSSPPKKGFNLVAWITPFAAVLAGAAGLYFILKMWVLKGREPIPADQALAQPVSVQETEEYRSRLEQELRMYKEEGAT